MAARASENGAYGGGQLDAGRGRAVAGRQSVWAGGGGRKSGAGPGRRRWRRGTSSSRCRAARRHGSMCSWGLFRPLRAARPSRLIDSDSAAACWLVAGPAFRHGPPGRRSRQASAGPALAGHEGWMCGPAEPPGGPARALAAVEAPRATACHGDGGACGASHWPAHRPWPPSPLRRRGPCVKSWERLGEPHQGSDACALVKDVSVMPDGAPSAPPPNLRAWAPRTGQRAGAQARLVNDTCRRCVAVPSIPLLSH